MSPLADITSGVNDLLNPILRNATPNSPGVNCGHQSEGFEFFNCCAYSWALQSTSFAEVNLRDRSHAVARIPEQRQPDCHLSRFQIPHCNVDKLVQIVPSVRVSLRGFTVGCWGFWFCHVIANNSQRWRIIQPTFWWRHFDHQLPTSLAMTSTVPENR